MTRLHSSTLVIRLHCIHLQNRSEKEAVGKNFFFNVYVIDANLLRSIFFIPCDKWKTLFLRKDCLYFEIFSTAIFFETSVLKEFCTLHYLHNNNTVLILKFQNIAIVYYTYIVYCTCDYDLINFAANLFYYKTFYTLLFFDCSRLFFL